MKVTMKTALAGLAALLLAGSAIAADKKIVLKMFNSHLKGQNQISLKREIRDQFPNLRLRRFTLANVVVVAKSKHGNGKAKLEVNRTTSFNHRVDGYASDFRDSAAYTFDRIKIQNPAYNSRGQWSIHLKGNIKVKKIVVNLDRVNSHGDFEPTPRVRFTEVGKVQFSKIYDETKRVRIAKDNVKVIKIKAKKSALKILDVEVVFKNGNSRFLSQLEGVIFNGDTKEIRFNKARDVRALRITAVARRTGFGGGSVLKVSVGQQRR